jgi:uncharacterized protein (TIGR00369 family)
VSELLDPTCDALGIVADSIAPGRAVLRLTVTDAMTNAHGMAHGGYLFLLADAAFAFAANSGEPVTVGSVVAEFRGQCVSSSGRPPAPA